MRPTQSVTVIPSPGLFIIWLQIETTLMEQLAVLIEQSYVPCNTLFPRRWSN